jgi:VanZ family protein
LVVEFAFAAYTLALVYVSFVPFDFTSHPQYGPRSHLVWGLVWASFGIPDILANIAVYVPLGGMAFAFWRRRRMRRILSGMAALVFAGALSFVVEQGQHWVASRVASWTDVVANALGGLLGMLLLATMENQVRRMASRARWAAYRNPWQALSKASVCVVLLIQLRPYDVVVDVFHTAAALRHADVSPLARWRSLPSEVAAQVHGGRLRRDGALARARSEYVIDRAADTAGYAAVTTLAVLASVPLLRSRWLLYLWAGFIGSSLAVLVTMIRVFLISHGLDTAHFLCGVIGWPLGCLLAEFVLHSAGHTRPAGENAARKSSTVEDSTAECPPFENMAAQSRDNATSHAAGGGTASPLPAWQKLAVVCAVLIVAAYELVPFDCAAGLNAGLRPLLGRVCWLPVEAHFHSRPNDAFYDMSGDLLRYATLGVGLAMVLAGRSSRPWRRQLWTTVLAVGGLSLLMETLHAFMPSRQADTTTILLALAGGFCGAVAVRWLRDYYDSLRVFVVEDLLTSQLIEGQTYQDRPAIKPRHPVGRQTNRP